MKEKILRISRREVFRYLMPIILGYFVMFLFPWNLIWITFERIFQVSLGTSNYDMGNTLFRLTMICFIAVDLKWNIRQEKFYEKGKMDLKIKILCLFFLFLLDGVFPEIIWNLQGYTDEIGGIYDNSPFLLDSFSILNILLLADTFVRALIEELLFRYITCNCLRKLHINNGVIIVLQAVLFTVVHRYGIMDSLNVFMGGLIYGIILYLTRTPFCGWLLHSAYNLKVASDGPMENWLSGIVFLISVIYIVISERSYKKKMRKRKNVQKKVFISGEDMNN